MDFNGIKKWFITRTRRLLNKIALLFLFVVFIFPTTDISARQLNNMTAADREQLDDEIESLKFRINELTREVALLKTAFLKLSGPRGDSQNTSDKPEKIENSNFISVKSDKSLPADIIVLDKKIADKQPRQNQQKSGDSDNTAAGRAGTNKNRDLNNLINLNIIYESRPSVAKPLVYNVFSTGISAGKNLKILFSFDRTMLFMSAISSNNFKLLSQDTKSREFMFQITDYTKTFFKLAFSAAAIGELNSQLVFFEDLNKNNRFDGNESRGQRDLYQTIILEE